MKAWQHVAVILTFVFVMVTSSFFLGSIWVPLGAIPFLLYFYIAGRYNLQRCVCSHRFISHNPYNGWCLKCTNQEGIWEYDENGDLKPKFCLGPQTPSQAAEEILYQ